jgi:ribosomal protein S14
MCAIRLVSNGALFVTTEFQELCRQELCRLEVNGQILEVLDLREGNVTRWTACYKCDYHRPTTSGLGIGRGCFRES